MGGMAIGNCCVKTAASLWRDDHEPHNKVSILHGWKLEIIPKEREQDMKTLL